jgi:hypothetical protein
MLVPLGPLPYVVEAKIASPYYRKLSGDGQDLGVVPFQVAGEVMLSGQGVLSADGIKEVQQFTGLGGGVGVYGTGTARVSAGYGEAGGSDKAKGDTGFHRPLVFSKIVKNDELAARRDADSVDYQEIIKILLGKIPRRICLTV